MPNSCFKLRELSDFISYLLFGGDAFELSKTAKMATTQLDWLRFYASGLFFMSETLMISMM